MADPIILEKAVFALTLLDLLARTGLDFVFKGGTALLLHLPQPNRLSIDIDIVCDAPQPEFESALDGLLSKSPFLRWDEQTRGERGLPGRRHYRFHFQSPTQGQEMHILLDVVTEPNVLIHIVERPVNTAFLEIAEPIAVKTPRLESLLADKLTAFAPGTIGVPLTAQFSQQVIKQLFDIAQLYDHAQELSILAEDNRNAFEAEARYRGFTGSYSDYLDDVIQAAFHICSLDLKGAPKDRAEENRLYRRGIVQLGNHLVSVPFRLPEAKVAAAKAARLAMLLKASALSNSLPVFDPALSIGLREKQLAGPFACLNRLKSFAPEVFFYWT
ncbi:MAG: nucleotidyl transferase AbiEii/AbiGii toxin family protein [Verrucomicrobiota bacterium]